ncbi:Transcription initiation factor TFIID subunit 3 [Candida viswanathii]|uniref:Transcription initiation factor TFIID subunit 3 n=1 Tax=Candida viswanathii TaxID=5486 RepID=A0A367YB10_9ASCO|nr:Transcription initiation factor TFIID subunit 3 [Candida viswanathii]
MDDSFYFALLRVSVAQILKANGFDKCKPSTLNVVTDLYLQIFQNAIKESLKCSSLRTNSNSPEIQDITQALINIGLFKVNELTRIHDKYFGESKYDTKSVESLHEWCARSEQFAIEKKLNELPNNLIKNLIEKRKLDIDDGESDLAKRKRKHKERQEFYNQLKLNDDQRQRKVDEDELNEDIITDKDKLNWFNYLIEKDLKLGHDLKFLNTDPIIIKEFLKYQNNYKFHPVDTSSNKKEKYNNWDRIQNHLKHMNKTDHIVGDVTAEEANSNEADKDLLNSLQTLNTLLPYNLEYDQNLLEDDLTKFYEPEPEPASESQPAKEDEQQVIHDGEGQSEIPNRILEQDNTGDVLVDNEEIGGENSLIFM